MKRLFLILIVLLCISEVKGQYSYGIETGLGNFFAFPFLRNYDDYHQYGYQVKLDPAFDLGLSIQKKISKKISLGVNLYEQQYVIHYHYFFDDWGSNYYYISNFTIDYKSTLLFISPYLEIQPNKNKNLHVYLSLGYGMLLSGNQTSVDNVAGDGGGGWSTSTFYKDIKNDMYKYNIVQISLGFKQDIFKYKQWQIYLKEELRVIPSPEILSSELNMLCNWQVKSHPFENIPYYFTLQLGIKHNQKTKIASAL